MSTIASWEDCWYTKKTLVAKYKELNYQQRPVEQSEAQNTRTSQCLTFTTRTSRGGVASMKFRSQNIIFKCQTIKLLTKSGQKHYIWHFWQKVAKSNISVQKTQNSRYDNSKNKRSAISKVKTSTLHHSCTKNLDFLHSWKRVLAAYPYSYADDHYKVHYKYNIIRPVKLWISC